MYNPPECIDAEASIENFITAIKNSLQYWLDMHTDCEAWAAAWNFEYVWQDFLKNTPIISNKYFTFDLKSACLEVYAKNTLDSMYRCKFCGSLYEAGFEDCDCEGQEYDDDNYDQLNDEDDLEYYIEWLEDIGFIIPEYMIQDAMETKGFEVYQKALSDVILSTVEDVKNALQMFEDAESNEDLLNVALIASSILHINGNILEDYGNNTGLDYDTVCKYRDNGLTALFDKDEIESFILSDERICI